MPAHDDARPRRTFAVISHPDAGKSTLTEALALHAAVITEAGAVHGKAGRRGTVSDWMEMEKARGISITSAALQFAYRDHVVNLVDTPGHTDFSEDTYRVLSAVDSAVMLVDAAKGLEPQTLKLFQVCAHRGIPVITVINKWDRPGLDPLELMDPIEQQIKLEPDPADLAGRRGRRLPRRPRPAYRRASCSTPAPPAAPPAPPSERLDADEAEADEGDGLDRRASRSTSCSPPTTPTTTRTSFLAGRDHPGAVRLRAAELRRRPAARRAARAGAARPARPRRRSTASVREVDDDFSAFVFKVQSGMNTAHRDRLAYARVCSGVFERGMVVTHAADRPAVRHEVRPGRLRPGALRRSRPPFPGDIIGLVNANALRVGDTIYVGEPVALPADRQLRPRALRDRARRATPVATSSSAAASSSSTRRASCRCCARTCAATSRPVLAAVGPMQFEVVRGPDGASEFKAPVRLERLDYSVARRTDAAGADALAGMRGVEVLQRSDGTPPRALRRPVARQDRHPGPPRRACSRPCPPAPADPAPDMQHPLFARTKEVTPHEPPAPRAPEATEPAPQRPARRRPRRPRRDRPQHDRLRARRARC